MGQPVFKDATDRHGFYPIRGILANPCPIAACT